MMPGSWCGDDAQVRDAACLLPGMARPCVLRDCANHSSLDHILWPLPRPNILKGGTRSMDRLDMALGGCLSKRGLGPTISPVYGSVLKWVASKLD